MDERNSLQEANFPDMKIGLKISRFSSVLDVILDKTDISYKKFWKTFISWNYEYLIFEMRL